MTRSDGQQTRARARERRTLVVVLASGVRVEGLTVAEVAELARRLS